MAGGGRSELVELRRDKLRNRPPPPRVTGGRDPRTVSLFKSGRTSEDVDLLLDKDNLRRRPPWGLEGGLGLLPSEDPGGVGGGVVPGCHSRMAHQFRCGRRCLLFLGLPSTPCWKRGIMSSSVCLSKWCTLFLLFNTSAIKSGGGVLAMADEIMLGMYRGSLCFARPSLGLE